MAEVDEATHAPEKTEAAEGADAADAGALPPADFTDSNLHLSCRRMKGMTLEKVERVIAEMSPVPLQKVFKLRQWTYAFVSVKPEHIAAFREALHGSICNGADIVVKEGHARDANSRKRKGADEEDWRGKKPRKDFPEGHVPTLKDLIDRAKGRKGDKERTMLQKSAPLLEYLYETQLTMKGTYVKSAVRAFTKLMRTKCDNEGLEPPAWTTPEWCKASRAPYACGCPVDPIVSTPVESHHGYRNKCEFTIGKDEEGNVEVGFVKRVNSDADQIVASPDEVPFVPEAMKKLCRAVREVVKASGLQVFDRRLGEKTGVWRLVMARLSPEGKMLALVQMASVSEEKRKDLEAALVAGLGVASLYLQFNDTVSDAALPDAPLFHVHGSPRLDMPLLGLHFEIGPLSFFQTNHATCQLLYGKALEWLRPEGAMVLDVCCGVGTIGLCAAKRCHEVVGIELVPEAVESAKANTVLNGVKNATWRVGKAEDVLPCLLGDLSTEDERDVVAVVDPPRAGLHKDVLHALRECQKVSRLVYVSCNPDSLVEDVAKLARPRDDGNAFVPVRAVAVDMFPHTFHCEMVLLLERESRVKDPRPSPQDAKEQLVQRLKDLQRASPEDRQRWLDFCKCRGLESYDPNQHDLACLESFFEGAAAEPEAAEPAAGVWAAPVG